MNDDSVECPVKGCSQFVVRQRKVFRKKPAFQCPIHKIFISPTTFEYHSELENFLWIDEDDRLLIDRIMMVKRESRMMRDNSEDAVSWNVFRYLEKSNLIAKLIDQITGKNQGSAEIIYWSYSQKEEASWSWLNEARLEFGEQLNRSSEPDIIICTDKALFFIEAKISATNKTKPSNTDTLKNYLSGGANWFSRVFRSEYESVAIKSQKYELTRFWLLGTWIAHRYDLDFFLVNLVLEARERNIEALFNRHIVESPNRSFRRISWEQIYDFINSEALEGTDKDKCVSYFKNKTIGYNHKGNLEKAFSI